MQYFMIMWKCLPLIKIVILAILKVYTVVKWNVHIDRFAVVPIAYKVYKLCDCCSLADTVKVKFKKIKMKTDENKKLQKNSCRVYESSLVGASGLLE